MFYNIIVQIVLLLCFVHLGGFVLCRVVLLCRVLSTDSSCKELRLIQSSGTVIANHLGLKGSE